jgi:hypothetical protein
MREWLKSTYGLADSDFEPVPVRPVIEALARQFACLAPPANDGVIRVE